jgi:AcrR family transcriptional regulator
MSQEETAAQKLPPGRHGLPRQFVLHNQRARLVDAATQVFGTRSYAEARVADVLELAAISRKTFYEQFRDKEDCFLAAYEAAAQRAEEQIRAATRDKSDWAGQLRSGLDALLRFLCDEPQLARLLVVEVMGAGPAARKRRDQVIESFEAILTGDGGAGVPAELVVGGFWEVVHHRVSTDRCGELPGLTNALADCALALIDEPTEPRHAATG